MAKWIDYSVDERKALIAKVAQAKNIDEAAAEKDWWVTAQTYYRHNERWACML